ncbi:DUF6355 family natural product biosynthesis protein [Arthrobacter sp. ATA002]|uniref:DUF6355 family natural product biosynthesis protein n=1 Tax=Arthrobacter sp. ATA002 TaxID=2991715 RepID=UPI0022A6EBE8|nr:DUF6355 family natural product biosynthesis protein [Arthrobacter sp. ATA002]WAP50809.1 DUF6355 family natural product biosynthesis protein [Arthrobacter sp. ATA002]
MSKAIGEDHEFRPYDLPIVGSVDLFGGKREMAHYGHCGDGNVRITVNTADGDESLCVQPGDTVWGLRLWIEK